MLSAADRNTAVHNFLDVMEKLYRLKAIIEQKPNAASMLNDPWSFKNLLLSSPYIISNVLVDLHIAGVGLSEEQQAEIRTNVYGKDEGL